MDNNSKKTVRDVIESMTEEQRMVMFGFIKKMSEDASTIRDHSSKNMFDRFLIVHQYDENEIRSYHRTGSAELTIRLNSGEIIIYNDVTGKAYQENVSNYILDNTTYKELFGRNLKQQMDMRGISQKILSERTGINRSILNGYVNGKHDPTTKQLRLICDALKCSPNVLMNFIKHEVIKDDKDVDNVLGGDEDEKSWWIDI